MIWTAEEFNEAWGGSRRLTGEELTAIRERRGELFRQWSAVAAGETLKLEYA